MGYVYLKTLDIMPWLVSLCNKLGLLGHQAGQATQPTSQSHESIDGPMAEEEVSVVVLPLG